MFTSRRFLPLALVLIGLSIAVITGTLQHRVTALVDGTDRAGRETIGRAALTEVGTASAVILIAALSALWVHRRDRRRRRAADALTRTEYRDALASRAEALKRERHARAEAELANELKDDFLATVSHELRTPLNAIVGWTHVLKRGLLAAKDRQRAIDAIDRNAAEQTRLVNDLLDVSRLIQGRLKLSVSALDLRAIVRAAADTLGPAAAAKNLAFTVRLDPDEVPVAGDEARLQQVVWHLLSNAVKFTPTGGHVGVEVSRLGSRARLRVTDTGEGIDVALLPHVFDSFRHGARPGRAGLGLGLAIVRHVVELHGGMVGVESPGRGRGSVFTLTLPVGRRSAEREVTATRAGPHSTGSFRTAS